MSIPSSWFTNWCSSLYMVSPFIWTGSAETKTQKHRHKTGLKNCRLFNFRNNALCLNTGSFILWSPVLHYWRSVSMTPSRKRKLGALRFHDSQGLHRIVRAEKYAETQWRQPLTGRFLAIGNTSDTTEVWLYRNDSQSWLLNRDAN